MNANNIEAHREPTGIEASVCEDIAARQRGGVAKYGMTVADNPADLPDRLQHAYEEALDGAIYLKWAIPEVRRLEDAMQEAWRLVNAMAGQEHWDRAERWLDEHEWAKPDGAVRL